MHDPNLELDLDENQDHDLPVEVVDELVFDAVDEGLAAGGDRRSKTGRAYRGFVQALTDVAETQGADGAGIARLRALLGIARLDGVSQESSASAWRAVLAGTSEDYAGCGSNALDEWAASVVSRVTRDGRTDVIRRELRQRGVAAFGFLASAA